jgi:prolyl-tRNA synthetase
MEEAPGQSKSALKKAEKQAKMAAAKAEKAATVPIRGGAGASKKADESKQIIGMTVSKEANFSQWYHELVIKAELVEYYSEVR